VADPGHTPLIFVLARRLKTESLSLPERRVFRSACNLLSALASELLHSPAVATSLLREVQYQLASESQEPIKASMSHGLARHESSGIRSLMLAVFEDGIRTYCRGCQRDRLEAEQWVWDPDQHSPFSFAVICQVLGLDPSAVRVALPRLQPRRHRVRPRVDPVRKIKPAQQGGNPQSILPV
jgi:hypothetical protein